MIAPCLFLTAVIFVLSPLSDNKKFKKKTQETVMIKAGAKPKFFWKTTHPKHYIS